MARSKTVGAQLVALSLAALTVSASVASGCATTEFYSEGPGQPPERSKGTVPKGSVGVCKRQQTKRPPIVTEAIWEHAPFCNSRTPDTFIQIGYGRAAQEGGMGVGDAEAEKWMERLLATWAEGSDPKEGNNRIVTMLRGLQDYAIRQPLLRDRVTRESSRPTPCDFTYMLNIMEQEQKKIAPNDQCPAYVYDPKERKDACLFDMNVKGLPWVTSSWDCMTRVKPAEAKSCHLLCAYDDYCVRQVSCTATDVDLMLCAAGVCLPEVRTPVF